jgi:hypothetical protein
MDMLMYLSVNTHPDIAFAAHQAAHQPHHSHALPDKRIVSYLKHEGLYLCPGPDQLAFMRELKETRYFRSELDQWDNK